jgi:hypothetical protein
MSQATPLLQLSKPTVGGPETNNNWGSDLNRNFDKLDTWVGPLPGRITALEAQTGIPGPPGPTGPRGPSGPPGTISTSPPSGGLPGDVWYQVT